MEKEVYTKKLDITLWVNQSIEINLEYWQILDNFIYYILLLRHKPKNNISNIRSNKKTLLCYAV